VIAQNLAAIERRIADAALAAGRFATDVRLLPVSKTRPASELAEAMACGYKRFGENRVQEVVAKAAELPEAEWAVIGHLQSNKARQVAELASEFQALDSLELASQLDRRLHTAGRRLDTLIQVNSSGEDSKFGLPPGEVVAFARDLEPFDALRVRGLMTLALPGSDREAVAACFVRMREVQDDLRQAGALGSDWEELSMGMSGDFGLAIAYGATCVRVGTAIFGARA